MLTVEICAMCGCELEESETEFEDEDCLVRIEFSEFPVRKCGDCIDAVVTKRAEAVCRL